VKNLNFSAEAIFENFFSQAFYLATQPTPTLTLILSKIYFISFFAILIFASLTQIKFHKIHKISGKIIILASSSLNSFSRY